MITENEQKSLDGAGASIEQDWGGHPLFPRPATAKGPDLRKFDLIRIQRWLPDGTKEVCSKVWSGSELRSLEQVVDMYGGDCTYRFIALCGKTNQFQAYSAKYYVAGPARKPFHRDTKHSGDAPTPPPRQHPMLDMMNLFERMMERQADVFEKMIEHEMRNDEYQWRMQETLLRIVLERPAPPNPFEQMREAMLLLQEMNMLRPAANDSDSVKLFELGLVIGKQMAQKRARRDSIINAVASTVSQFIELNADEEKEEVQEVASSPVATPEPHVQAPMPMPAQPVPTPPPTIRMTPQPNPVPHPLPAPPPAPASQPQSPITQPMEEQARELVSLHRNESSMKHTNQTSRQGREARYVDEKGIESTTGGVAPPGTCRSAPQYDRRRITQGARTTSHTSLGWRHGSPPRRRPGAQVRAHVARTFFGCMGFTVNNEPAKRRLTMAIRKSFRRGEPHLFIDIRYTAKNGEQIRFRKDAQVQTMIAAKAEEKRYLLNIAQYGSPYEPIVEDEASASDSSEAVKTFADVVNEFRQTYMLANLKITTRKGYEAVLVGRLIPRFGSMPITRVDGRAAEALDLEQAKRKLKPSTRNNVQIILRSILQFAVKRQYIPAMPTNMPSLAKIGQSVLEIPSDEQVAILLAKARKSHRLSFLLMSDAGLRPNEVRALRRRDVQLQYEHGEPVGGFITIRQGWSHGETHTPKTGQREVPISPELSRELAPEMHGERDGPIAVSHRGTPWGQHGLAQAFERVIKQAGLKGWSVYCLRHYAITSWLRAGIPVHVVQRMAGHVHLSTTQRYVHFLKADLEDAARKIAARGRGAIGSLATTTG